MNFYLGNHVHPFKIRIFYANSGIGNEKRVGTFLIANPANIYYILYESQTNKKLISENSSIASTKAR